MGRWDHIGRELQTLMDPGEEIRWIIPATWNRGSYAIVVSDLAVRVVPLTRWWPPWPPAPHVGTSPQVVYLPRATRLGPVHGKGAILVNGRRYWVAGFKRYVDEADAELDQGGPTTQ